MDKFSPTAAPIMLVDDEPNALLSYTVMLKSAGYDQLVALDNPRKVMPFLTENPVALIVLDLSMPFISGQELLHMISPDFPDIPILIVTATNELDIAVECMRHGASDYLVKPVEKNRFLSSITRAMEIHSLRQQVSTLTRCLLAEELQNPAAFSDIITGSKKMLAIFHYIEAIALSPFPVLIIGETGTGKELIARAIHRVGGSSQPFVAVNVAGLDDTMFSDTLFGHQKGAFTGADSHRDGLVAQAHNGFLFLDEIGDLTLASQVKLLRLIQEKEYFPLGSDVPRKVKLRLLASTNQNLEKLVEKGTFRKDLFYRLRAHRITLPSLQERIEDLPLLVDHILAQAAKHMKKRTPIFPPQLITLLNTYEFPGNVRELETMVYDAVSRHTRGVLSTEHFKSSIKGHKPVRPISTNAQPEELEKFFSHFPTLQEAEEFLIKQAFRKARGNQGITASLLGISRQALNKRLKRHKNLRQDIPDK